ncbi:MAG TPA: type I DNA topoisomerase [Candidatus Moranbacteria bacterium]|nr:type I DNA topoisomerase [Candidatus Moranbacteria bacterium]
MKKLVIVESPAKIKTLTKYFGPDYIIEASIGHIRDLPKNNKQAIDIENDFKPSYVISPDKEKVVNKIKALAKKSKEVLLATDPDREGEAIAWHIAEAIGLKNPKRVTFNEITKEAVIDALKNPRPIDQNLKTAQEARRVLDRLFGYDLSGLIWKKVRYGLSAGRVQSPALRILMEREREIRAFISEKYWIITATVKNKQGKEFILICSKEPRDKKEVTKIIQAGKKEGWTVTDVKETKAKRNPRPPFITSTLQQTASSRLGFSPSRTMMVAQKLYTAGLITYMRTDSTNLSKQAQSQIAKVVKKEFGENYYAPRHYSKKSKSAQEAHEAIRPSNADRLTAGKSSDEKRLYELIWRRTVSSQMSPANILRTKIIVNLDNGKIPFFSIRGSRILFDGWLKADPASRSDDVELPAVEIGEKLKFVKIENEEKETTPPPRYSEAGLVKELEKRGIGRPSTYAPIIKTLKDRNYVEKEGSQLKPTDTGDVVSTFLEKHFTKYISDKFTAEMETDLDEIAEGKRKYLETLQEFYTPFTKDIKSKEAIPKITDLGKADKKFKCPICKGPMIIKLGKTGKFMSCKKFPDCSGARTIEGKELEGPKETGEKCPKCKDGKLVTREGRFGKFISCNNYPKCKYIKEDPEEVAKKKTGIKCPKCKTGEMTEKRGRFGIFYACSNYPKCKYAINAKPTGKKCPLCKALMMEGTKTIPERCSDKKCPNNRPDKLEKSKK